MRTSGLHRLGHGEFEEIDILALRVEDAFDGGAHVAFAMETLVLDECAKKEPIFEQELSMCEEIGYPLRNNRGAGV